MDMPLVMSDLQVNDPVRFFFPLKKGNEEEKRKNTQRREKTMEEGKGQKRLIDSAGAFLALLFKQCNFAHT